MILIICFNTLHIRDYINELNTEYYEFESPDGENTILISYEEDNKDLSNKVTIYTKPNFFSIDFYYSIYSKTNLINDNMYSLTWGDGSVTIRFYDDKGWENKETLDFKD